MILVRNLLQQLNGSKKLRQRCLATSIVCLSVFVEVAFAFSDVPYFSKDTIPLNERSGKGIIRIDTIQWRDVTEQLPPISDEIVVAAKDSSRQKTLKDKYVIQFLMPFGASTLSDPASSRFVHFYAGVLMALDVLRDEGVSLQVKVTDIGEKETSWKSKIPDIFSNQPDVIVGPLERDDIRILMDSCLNRKTTLVSPWYSFAKIPADNPYYVQLKPNLRSHYSYLVQQTTANYQKGEVVIVGRKNKDTDAWIQFFQDKASEVSGIKNFYSVYYAHNDSIQKGPTAFFKLFTNPDIKAVVLPNFSFADESWLYNVVRRLAAEKPANPVTVYGMPLLYESGLIDADILSALNMNVVTTEFVDDYDEGVKNFKRLYLDAYGEIPFAEAVRGYDLMIFLGRNLFRYGPFFQKAITNKVFYGLQSNFTLHASVMKEEMSEKSTESSVFYDNTFLELIKFENNRWVRQQ
jgi:hypothetical protein